MKFNLSSPLNKQKLLAEKIYSPNNSSPKRNLQKVTQSKKPLILGHFLKKPHKMPNTLKTHENTALPTQQSSTPKGLVSKNRRMLSQGVNPMHIPSQGVDHLRNSSVNPTPNIIFKYASATQTGFIPSFPQKENQDSCLEIYNPEISMFGIFDGHGVHGGSVSDYIKNRLPLLFSKGTRDVKSSIKSAISIIKEELPTLIDTSFSGSTLNVVMIKGKKLFCANIGDSRAIVGNQINDISSRTSSGKKWASVSLSRDHKPDIEEEAARINRAGGRVLPYFDESGNPAGPARVWIKDQNIPGLAMSRSIGDAVAASVGVIAEPEIIEYELTSQDKFLVIGSDGVFEFLKNEEIVKLIIPFWRNRDPQGACKIIVSSAEYRWRSVRNI